MGSATAVAELGPPPRSRWRRAWIHLARIRYRLLLINLVVVAVPLGGIAFARRHERQLLAALERDMIDQAALVRAMVATDPDGPRLAARAPMLVGAARTTRTRVRLLDATGVVVADSHASGPPEGAEPAAPTLYGDEPSHVPEVPAPVDVAGRREVQAALAGRYGAATRLWDRQERVYLFAALPITIGGEVVGVVYVTRSTQGVKRQLYQLRTWLVGLLAVALAATAILSLFLAATIARPLARLTRAAGRIAAGDRRARLALDRADEIGQLSRAVDRMATELDRRARDQRALAADISHELKTPLTGIRGAAELLADGAADEPASRARFLAMILADAARLDRLVTRLLELARFEADDATPEDVDLASALTAAAGRYRGAAPLACAIDRDAPTLVRARRPALAATLDNLYANAGQHAAPGSTVTVTLTRVRGAARIAVHNHGAPISPAVQARVWDRFFTTRGDRGGSGLGLAIVRAVAVGHGGTAGLISTPADGTTFWIELPA